MNDPGENATRRRRLPDLRRAGLAVLAGLAIAASMPPWGFWPLAIVGIVLVDLAIAEQPRWRRFRLGWLAGAAWLVPSTVWMLDFSPAGYAAAGLILSAYLGVACALVPAQAPWRWLALPGALALAELARWSFPFGGVPLSTIPMSQVASPLGPVVRLGGGPLLTIVTAAVAVAVAAGAARRWRIASGALVAVVAVAALTVVSPRATPVGSLEVAVVQGGGPQRTRAVDTDPDAPFERQLEASAQVRGPVDVVLWPENVVNVDGPLAGSDKEARLVELARRLDAVVVPGIVESFDGYFLNASVAISPEGEQVSRYDKVQRVPFGEYVPFRAIVDPLSGGIVSKYIPQEARAGTGPALLQTAVGPLATVISWEVFFERRAREGLQRGGEVLLNPTNGSSYWLTVVQSQQVASSRLRAMESDRWVLQAAPTGFSAIVSPTGAVLQRTGISEQKVLQGTIERRSGLTWATRFGPIPALLAALGLVVAANVAATRTRARAGDRDRAEDGTRVRPPATV